MFILNVEAVHSNKSGWRFFQNRLPTRDILKARGILSGDFVSCCPMYFIEDKTSTHLFFTFRFSKSVWQGVNDWFGVEAQDNIVGGAHYRLYNSLVEGEKSRRVNKFDLDGSFVVLMGVTKFCFV